MAETTSAGPIVAPPGQSAARASNPDTQFEDATYHAYDHNPVPWWVAMIWLGFVGFAIVYLLRYLGT